MISTWLLSITVFPLDGVILVLVKISLIYIHLWRYVQGFGHHPSFYWIQMWGFDWDECFPYTTSQEQLDFAIIMDFPRRMDIKAILNFPYCGNVEKALEGEYCVKIWMLLENNVVINLLCISVGIMKRFNFRKIRASMVVSQNLSIPPVLANLVKPKKRKRVT